MGSVAESKISRVTGYYANDRADNDEKTRSINMSNNLFISYDLYQHKDYSKVIAAIKNLSPTWAKVNLSVWWVNSTLTAEQARDQLISAFDKDDAFIVIDAKNNASAWNNLSTEVSKYLKENWAP